MLNIVEAHPSEQCCSEGIEPKISMDFGGAPRSLGATIINPITVFLTVACLAVGAGLGATGHLYLGIPVVIVAIVIASAPLNAVV